MTAKTSDVPVTRQRRAGARQAVDRAYGYLAAFFVLWLAITARRRRTAAGHAR
jgi:hypothetical protein